MTVERIFAIIKRTFERAMDAASPPPAVPDCAQHRLIRSLHMPRGTVEMRFASLEAFELHPLLIRSWEEELGETLLPAQEKAVKAGLLEGRSVVVLAPGSAGKTLVAEMAIGRAALIRGKTLYLSPTRALAEQKRAELARRFEPLGLSVAISTRDHCYADGAIVRGEFDVVVAVPEKMRALVARNPAVAGGVSLVVADEVHLVADRDRGPALEVLLGDLKALGAGQVVALSGALREAEVLARWLDAALVRETQRPVELRTGVMLSGEFRYKEHNSGRCGCEDIEYEPIGEGWGGQAGGLALALAGAGEATIVFVRDKGTANTLAASIAEMSGLPPCISLEEELAGCPDTAGVAMLRRLAASGVAVHHADLQAAERAAVEGALGRGELLLVVATSSLALGVNLPARNVIIDPVQWRGPTGAGAAPSHDALPQADFLAMAGRAGRLKFGEEFGRAIMIADAALQRDALVAYYIEAEPPSLRPALGAMPAADAVAVLSTSALAAAEGLEAAWRASLSALARGSPSLPGEHWSAASVLVDAGLLNAPDLRPTPRLQAAAGATVDAATLLWLHRLAEFEPRAVDWLAALVMVCASPYMARMPFPLCRAEMSAHDFVRELLCVAEDRGEGGEVLASVLADETLSPERKQKAAKMTMALMAWSSGLSAGDVEQQVGVPAGRLEMIAGCAAWLMQVAADMAEAGGWPRSCVQRFHQAACALRAGTSVEEVRRGGAEGQGAGGTRKRRDHPDALGRARAAEGRGGKGRSHGHGAGRHSRGRGPALVLDERQPDIAVLHGQRIQLRPAEFKLLWRLAMEPGACVPARDLVGFMLGADEWIGSHQLYPHVRRLRRKIEKATGVDDGAAVLETVPRQGLRLRLSGAAVVLRRRNAEVAP